MRACPQCHGEIDSDAKICKTCGSVLLPTNDYAKEIQRASDSAKIIIRDYLDNKARNRESADELEIAERLVSRELSTDEWTTEGKSTTVHRVRDNGDVESWVETDIIHNSKDSWRHPDFKSAYPHFVQAARRGSARALVWVAQAYCEGWGDEYDLLSGSVLYQVAAQNDTLAHKRLKDGTGGLCGGLLADNGQWNRAEVKVMVEEAVLHGYSWAIYLLAKIYFDGKIVSVDYDRSLKMMKSLISIEQNLIDSNVSFSDGFEVSAEEAAKRHLALMYFDGLGGVEQDIDQAMYWVNQMKYGEYRLKTLADMFKTVRAFQGKLILRDLNDYSCSDDTRSINQDPSAFHSSNSIQFRLDDAGYERIVELASQFNLRYLKTNKAKGACLSFGKSGIMIERGRGYECTYANGDICDWDEFLSNDISVRGVNLYIGDQCGSGVKRVRHLTMKLKDVTSEEVEVYLKRLRSIILMDRVQGTVFMDGAVSNGYASPKEKGRCLLETIRRDGDWNRQEYIDPLKEMTEKYDCDLEQISEAWYYLGRIYLDGKVLPGDEREALNCFENSSLPMADYFVGKMRLASNNLTCVEKADVYVNLERAAKSGIDGAEELLKKLKDEGYTDEKVIKIRKKAYERAARRQAGVVRRSFGCLWKIVIFVFGIGVILATLSVGMSYVGGLSTPEAIRPAVERLSVTGMQIRDAARGLVSHASKDATVTADATPVEENAESSAAINSEPDAKKLPVTESQIKYGALLAAIVVLLIVLRNSGMAEGGFLPFVSRTCVLGWCLYKVGEIAIVSRFYSTAAVLLAVALWVLMSVCRGRSRGGWWRWLIMAGCFGAGLSGLQSAGIVGAVVLLLGPARVK